MSLCSQISLDFVFLSFQTEGTISQQPPCAAFLPSPTTEFTMNIKALFYSERNEVLNKASINLEAPILHDFLVIFPVKIVPYCYINKA